MREYKLIVLCIATFSLCSGGIDELLSKASAVIEGSVVNATIVGRQTTLQIKVSSVLFGKVSSIATLDVTCNGLKNVHVGPSSQALPQIYFLQSTQLGVLECLPVFILGYSNLGMLGYPQAPPCPDGNLFLLAPSSTREKIFARVAESALCGAPHFWQSVLDASSSGLKPIGSDDSFDRRIFKELVKSTRHNLHFEGILGLITSGDALPFDLIAKNPEEYRANNQEWKTILSKIDSTLQDPSVIPQLQKILVVPDPNLRLATATALQRFHTHAAVVNLGKMLESPVVEKELGLMAAKGLADYANGCPMTTTSSFKTPADYFPHCDEKAPFRTDETVSNSRHNPEIPGDDDQKISYWKGWWLSNGNRVAALASQQP